MNIESGHHEWDKLKMKDGHLKWVMSIIKVNKSIISQLDENLVFILLYYPQI